VQEIGYDQILLEGMIFHGHVGVLPSERITGQDFQVDAVIFCLPLAACTSDELDQTIDYGRVFELVGQVVAGARYELLERLAQDIADQILERFSLADHVEIMVRKPNAPIKGCFTAMGVRITRGRN
jgi:7,8-dihydroneopterin aldolase/epimerase/oxygenase